MLYRITCYLMMFAVIGGCTFNVRIVKDAEDIPESTLRALNAGVNKYAVIDVGGSEFTCKIIGANNDRLTVSSREVVSEIPIKAIGHVTLYDAGAAKSSTVAMLIGGLTGGFLGDLAGREFGKDHEKDKEIRIGSAVLGACAGILAIKYIGRGSSQELEVNSAVKPIELYPGYGKSLTAQTVQSKGLFQDLSLGAGETLLQTRIFQYEAGQYIAVYEVHNGKDTIVKWFTFDENYFKSQKAKLEQPLKDQIFRNSSLNGQ